MNFHSNGFSQSIHILYILKGCSQALVTSSCIGWLHDSFGVADFLFFYYHSCHCSPFSVGFSPFLSGSVLSLFFGGLRFIRRCHWLNLEYTKWSWGFLCDFLHFPAALQRVFFRRWVGMLRSALIWFGLHDRSLVTDSSMIVHIYG